METVNIPEHNIPKDFTKKLKNGLHGGVMLVYLTAPTMQELKSKKRDVQLAVSKIKDEYEPKDQRVYTYSEVEDAYLECRSNPMAHTSYMSVVHQCLFGSEENYQTLLKVKSLYGEGNIAS